MLILEQLGGGHAVIELLLRCRVRCIESHLLIYPVLGVVKTSVSGIIGGACRR